MLIRLATSDDAAQLWAIIEPTIRAGETYALPRDMTEAEAIGYWLMPAHKVWVCEDAGQVLGTYYMQTNQAGGGAHVANCGFMTSTAARGRGVGYRMGEHALETARVAGYRAMQFNFVVSTNETAVRLWQKLGFSIAGRMPLAFQHPVHGFVDALLMFRPL